MSDNPLEGKKAKYIQKKGERIGHIELRSHKSARNIALAKKKGHKNEESFSHLIPKGAFRHKRGAPKVSNEDRNPDVVELERISKKYHK